MSLSFKQHLQQSKAQLLSALEDEPRVILEYEIKHYCSVPTTADIPPISLKPRMKVVVEWDTQRQLPTAITLETVDSSIQLSCSTWATVSKLNSWLSRHTKGGHNRAHYVNRFQSYKQGS